MIRADNSLLEDIEQRHGAMREAMDEYRLKFPLDEVSKNGSIDIPIGSQNRLHVPIHKVRDSLLQNTMLNRASKEHPWEMVEEGVDDERANLIECPSQACQ